MSNNKWLRSFVIGAVLPMSMFIAHNIFAQQPPPLSNCGNGFLETGEECDLGKLNSSNSGCSDTCKINTYTDQQTGQSKKWTCNSDGVGYMNMITDNSNPNSLVSLYNILTSLSSSSGAPYSSNSALANCENIVSKTVSGQVSQQTIDACRQYVKNVALFKELNAQVSIETAAGGKDAAQHLNAKCTLNGPEIHDVDTKSFTMLTTPVTINCVPDATKGIR